MNKNFPPKLLVLLTAVLNLCLIPALAAPSSNAGSPDQAQMPSSRHTRFEVMVVLQPLSTKQRAQIDAAYQKSEQEKLQLSQELVDLFRQEVRDYPDIATKPMNDDNPPYRTLTAGQYHQFEMPRWNVYAEEALHAPPAPSHPSCTLAQYRQKEATLAAKLEACLDEGWQQVKPLLTQTQLKQLDTMREGWKASLQSAQKANARH
jgi:Spy/CpxP family protein refolding chaperone